MRVAYVVGEICIHDDNMVASAEVQSMDVGCSVEYISLSVEGNGYAALSKTHPKPSLPARGFRT